MSLGVSSTVILMILGVYETYLSAISILNMHVLTPMLVGLIIGGFIFMKITKWLLDRYHYATITGIIGFSLVSIFILWPGYHFDFTSLISIVILILGFVIGKNIK